MDTEDNKITTINDSMVVNGNVTIAQDEHGYRRYEDGVPHREDGPAMISIDEQRWVWYKHGIIHRVDGPAKKDQGREEWFFEGKRHRDGDLPAVDNHGRLEWWKHGFRHREGDLPAIQDPHLSEWWVNGLRHRPNGLEAVIDLGHDEREWWENGLAHREGGPCLISRERVEWKIRGEFHRDGDLPALIKLTKYNIPFGHHAYYPTVGEVMYTNGITEADEHVTRVEGKNNEMGWWKCGRLHRDHRLPATIATVFGKDGVEKRCSWAWKGAKVTKEAAFELWIKCVMTKLALFRYFSCSCEDDLFVIAQMHTKH